MYDAAFVTKKSCYTKVNLTDIGLCKVWANGLPDVASVCMREMEGWGRKEGREGRKEERDDLIWHIAYFRFDLRCPNAAQEKVWCWGEQGLVFFLADDGLILYAYHRYKRLQIDQDDQACGR